MEALEQDLTNQVVLDQLLQFKNLLELQHLVRVGVKAEQQILHRVDPVDLVGEDQLTQHFLLQTRQVAVELGEKEILEEHLVEQMLAAEAAQQRLDQMVCQLEVE